MADFARLVKHTSFIKPVNKAQEKQHYGHSVSTDAECRGPRCSHYLYVLRQSMEHASCTKAVYKTYKYSRATVTTASAKIYPPTHEHFRGLHLGSRQCTISKLAAVLHTIHLAYCGLREPLPVTKMENCSSSPGLLPPELLFKIATSIYVAVDLQNLRLVNRAFSKAATLVLQDGPPPEYICCQRDPR